MKRKLLKEKLTETLRNWCVEHGVVEFDTGNEITNESEICNFYIPYESKEDARKVLYEAYLRIPGKISDTDQGLIDGIIIDKCYKPNISKEERVEILKSWDTLYVEQQREFLKNGFNADDDFIGKLVEKYGGETIRQVANEHRTEGRFESFKFSFTDEKGNGLLC